jgi:hypothetical protein
MHRFQSKNLTETPDIQSKKVHTFLQPKASTKLQSSPAKKDYKLSTPKAQNKKFPFKNNNQSLKFPFLPYPIHISN